MLAFVFAIAMAVPTCPMTIGIDDAGTLFSNRFYGWYQVSEKTIANDLKGGCYDDANPTAVSSVKLMLTPHAPKAKIDRVIAILNQRGWRKDRIQIEIWDGKAPASLHADPGMSSS